VSELPQRFICTFTEGKRTRLLRVSRSKLGWHFESWQSRYWSANGGGEITEARARLFFEEGVDVMIVSRNRFE
jgi:hypothetical protein